MTKESKIVALLKTSFGLEIWSLLEADDINEIMVNPDGVLWIEKFGEGVQKTAITMQPAQIESIIRLVASANDEICNHENPSIGAVLPGINARFQGLVPPIVPGPAFSLRRRATKVYSLQQYIDDGILEYAHARAIYRAVQDAQNILIVGGTGSGKTTLANAILEAISHTGDRIITIEDAAELQCSAPNHLSLYVRPEANFDWQDAVKASLRLRPDRIVVGEVRDGSALDLLKAWNTGHNGGCATIHANSAKRGLTRLESLIQEVSMAVPRELIGEAVNLVVHIKRTPKGRLVDEVLAVRGITKDGDYDLLPVDQSYINSFT